MAFSIAAAASSVAPVGVRSRKLATPTRAPAVGPPMTITRGESVQKGANSTTRAALRVEASIRDWIRADGGRELARELQEALSCGDGHVTNQRHSGGERRSVESDGLFILLTARARRNPRYLVSVHGDGEEDVSSFCRAVTTATRLTATKRVY